MTAHRPITPQQAIETVERAGVLDARRVFVDFAAAGLVKGYALVIETVSTNDIQSVRGATISADIWKRVQRDGLSDEVWRGGTLRLGADPASDLPEVNVTGLTFSDKSLQRLVDHHGGNAPQAKPAPTPAPDQLAPAVERQAANRRGPDPSAIPPGALLVSVKQAMTALGLGRTKVNALMNDGRLVRRKLDGRTAIEVESIRRLAAGSPR